MLVVLQGIKMKQSLPDYRITKWLGPLVLQISKHWALVNRVLPQAHSLEVLEDVDLAAFSDLPATKDALERELRERLQDARIERAALGLAKRSLYERMKWFRQMMIAYWHRSLWFSVLPLMPDVKAGAGEFMEPMREVARMWPKVAALPPVVPSGELVAPDGYSAGDFVAELAGLESLWRALYEAEQEVAIARGALLIFYRHAAAAVAAYGHAAGSRLAPGHELLASIPRLWRKKKVVKG